MSGGTKKPFKVDATTPDHLQKYLKKLESISKKDFPTKKYKFDNFCKNSLKINEPEVIDELWKHQAITSNASVQDVSGYPETLQEYLLKLSNIFMKGRAPKSMSGFHSVCKGNLKLHDLKIIDQLWEYKQVWSKSFTSVNVSLDTDQISASDESSGHLQLYVERLIRMFERSGRWPKTKEKFIIMCKKSFNLHEPFIEKLWENKQIIELRALIDKEKEEKKQAKIVAELKVLEAPIEIQPYLLQMPKGLKLGSTLDYLRNVSTKSQLDESTIMQIYDHLQKSAANAVLELEPFLTPPAVDDSSSIIGVTAAPDPNKKRTVKAKKTAAATATTTTADTVSEADLSQGDSVDGETAPEPKKPATKGAKKVSITPSTDDAKLTSPPPMEDSSVSVAAKDVKKRATLRGAKKTLTLAQEVETPPQLESESEPVVKKRVASRAKKTATNTDAADAAVVEPVSLWSEENSADVAAGVIKKRAAPRAKKSTTTTDAVVDSNNTSSTSENKDTKKKATRKTKTSTDAEAEEGEAAEVANSTAKEVQKVSSSKTKKVKKEKAAASNSDSTTTETKPKRSSSKKSRAIE